MPATRSTSRQTTIPFSKSKHAPGDTSHLGASDDLEIILVPSSDEIEANDTPSRRKPLKEKSTPGWRQLNSSMADEVIEISSAEEADSPSQATIIAQLRKQNKKLRQTISRHKQDIKKAQDDLALAELSSKGKINLDMSQLEDDLKCEICTCWLWAPYILSDCGHTYCQSCLQDWFNTTLAQFMTYNPTYNANRLHPYVRQLARNPRLHYYLNPVLMHQVLLPQPHYTCPTCREPVRTMPVENFALKSVVRTAATACGQPSPKKDGNRRGAAHTPWDGFFPNSLG